jgi:hypothetical protein
MLTSHTIAIVPGTHSCTLTIMKICTLWVPWLSTGVLHATPATPLLQWHREGRGEGGNCCVSHHSWTHVIPDRSCVSGQLCTNMIPNHSSAIYLSTMLLVRCCSNVFLGTIFAQQLHPGSNCCFTIGSKNGTHCFTKIKSCVSQKWLPNLTLDSPRLTGVCFATTSEVWTSAFQNS